jgi:hypothetical protein
VKQFLPSGALFLFVRQLFDGLVIGEQVKLTLTRVVAETQLEGFRSASTAADAL